MYATDTTHTLTLCRSRSVVSVPRPGLFANHSRAVTNPRPF